MRMMRTPGTVNRERCCFQRCFQAPIGNPHRSQTSGLDLYACPNIDRVVEFLHILIIEADASQSPVG